LIIYENICLDEILSGEIGKTQGVFKRSEVYLIEGNK
jgi:hypothetical protein